MGATFFEYDFTKSGNALHAPARQGEWLSKEGPLATAPAFMSNNLKSMCVLQCKVVCF